MLSGRERTTEILPDEKFIEAIKSWNPLKPLNYLRKLGISEIASMITNWAVQLTGRLAWYAVAGAQHVCSNFEAEGKIVKAFQKC